MRKSSTADASAACSRHSCHLQSSQHIVVSKKVAAQIKADLRAMTSETALARKLLEGCDGGAWSPPDVRVRCSGLDASAAAEATSRFDYSSEAIDDRTQSSDSEANV